MTTRSHMPIAILTAATSGFVALSYEIVWYRVFAFFTWGSAATFGVLLGVYLFGVALGAWGSRRFCSDRTPGGPNRGAEEAGADPKELFPLACFFLAANTLAYFVVPILARTLGMTQAGWPLGIVAIAAGAMGAVLPLTSHFAIAPDDRAGAKLSYLYVANIIGSATGSLLTGFVILEHLAIAQACFAISVVGWVVSIALFVASRHRVALGIGLALASTAVAMTGGRGFFDRVWERMYYKEHMSDDDRFAQVVENKHGVIAVTQDGTVLGGGAYDGRISTSLVEDRNGIVRAFAIGALHPHPKNILMIGVASGAWAQVIVNHPEVEKVTAIEINPGYVDVIRAHDQVKSLLDNPKLDLIFDDGRRWLQRRPDRKFDEIVMNTTWHWRAHSTNLLSREFMELAHAHLEPGGILFFNTTSSEDAMKTALTVFPHGMRVYNFMAASDAVLELDKARWERLLLAWTIDGKPVIDMSSESVRELFPKILAYPDTANEPPTPEGLERGEHMLASLGNARVITDDNMAPEVAHPLMRPDPR